jgi:hypothetical protein
MVDAVSTSCPGHITQRLSAIEDCEQERREYEPIGCGRELADWALCLTRGPVDCGDKRLGCGARRDALDACESGFFRGTGCRRNEGSDGLMCVPGLTNFSIESAGLPYSFLCVAKLPANCQHNPDSTALSCCSAFANDLGAYFEPFQSGPEDGPPDYSDVSFTDPMQCQAFANEQGWGTCEESTQCACQNCAEEIRACADMYSCLFVRKCSLGISDCNPSKDPYFTGYGAAASLEDALNQCMMAAKCAPRCP